MNTKMFRLIEIPENLRSHFRRGHLLNIGVLLFAERPACRQAGELITPNGTPQGSPILAVEPEGDWTIVHELDLHLGLEFTRLNQNVLILHSRDKSIVEWFG